MEAFKPLELEQEIMQYWDKIGLFKKIKAANKRVKGIEILAGAEVDIRPDGSI